MGHVVKESDLHRLVRELAKRTREEIDQAKLAIDNFEGISREYKIKFQWQDMSLDTDGHYLKGMRIITLNRRITHPERRNFSFCHELTHDRIECDDELREIIHEFTYEMSEQDEERLMERLCNIGAAELLIPSEEVREIIDQRGLSTELIPELCERFNASSLAVAFKMVSTALHTCYLFIAEKRGIVADKNQPILFKVKSNRNWHLWIIYSGSSPAAQYTMGRNYSVSSGHLMYRAIDSDGEVVQGIDDIPRRNSKNHRWEVKCDCLAYKGWVFGFFHETQPTSPNQLRLL